MYPEQKMLLWRLSKPGATTAPKCPLCFERSWEVVNCEDAAYKTIVCRGCGLTLRIRLAEEPE